MGTLILFPTTWRNSNEVEEHLNKLQDMYSNTHAAIFVECRFNKYEYMLRQQKLANYMRSKIKVIDGGLKDEPLDMSFCKKG